MRDWNEYYQNTVETTGGEATGHDGSDKEQSLGEMVEVPKEGAPSPWD